MKRNGPKERMSERPQIAAECVQMMAAAEKRRKTLGNKARLETISANEQGKAGKARRPEAGYTKLPAYVYVCTGKRRNERISLFSNPTQRFCVLFPAHISPTLRLSMSGGAYNIFPDSCLLSGKFSSTTSIICPIISSRLRLALAID